MDKKIFTYTQEELLKMLKTAADAYFNPQNVYACEHFIYAKGTTPILLVAHTDTVFPKPPKLDEIICIDGVLTCLTTGLGADDRAGVLMILDILRSGHRPSVLFCTDEEIGGIGAKKFIQMQPCELDVNLVIELDRMNSDDAVFYDCDNPEAVNYVEKFGFKESTGSFSDISFICPANKIAGVNLSVGYKHQHSARETLNIKDFEKTKLRVMQMLNNPPENVLKYIERRIYSYPSTYEYSAPVFDVYEADLEEDGVAWGEYIADHYNEVLYDFQQMLMDKHADRAVAMGYNKMNDVTDDWWWNDEFKSTLR